MVNAREMQLNFETYCKINYYYQLLTGYALYIADGISYRENTRPTLT